MAHTDNFDTAFRKTLLQHITKALGDKTNNHITFQHVGSNSRTTNHSRPLDLKLLIPEEGMAIPEVLDSKAGISVTYAKHSRGTAAVILMISFPTSEMLDKGVRIASTDYFPAVRGTVTRLLRKAGLSENSVKILHEEMTGQYLPVAAREFETSQDAIEGSNSLAEPYDTHCRLIIRFQSSDQNRIYQAAKDMLEEIDRQGGKTR